ncbi:LLM class flavin-dependent oxidoreductase [Kineococcus sp. SYSU DK001]|uniref:LLM class flavin-dependent oxidoreductase n=1 Tax=Kineococcus sp. SYSU DK001 TaxID=3383122 RepID=UPI003D7E65C5
MSRTEFGVGIGGTLPPGDYPGLGRALEEHGFHVVTAFGDLMMQPPALPLAAIAAVTERLRVGVGCYTPWTMHPVEIAGQIAYLDHLSGGRAFYGIVRGAWLDQLRLDTRRSMTAVRDTVAIVSSLLAASGEGHEGKVHGLAPKTAPYYPVLRPHVPLMVGTWSPQLAAFAGERADEVQVGGSANPAMVGVVRERVAVGEQAAGRDPGSVSVVMTAVTVVDHDGAAARELARREVALPFQVIAALDPTVEVDPELLTRMDGLLREHRMQEAGALIPDDLLHRFSFCGTPAEVADHAAEVYAAGATRIEFDSPFGRTPREGLDLLGRHVLPALRAQGFGVDR